MTRFPGAHAVLHALFDGAGQLDRGAMAQQMAYVRGFGVSGITVLGLATEVGKLSLAERGDIIRWAADDCGELPLSVTIAGDGVADQVALIRVAQAAGASWLILQPPPASVADPIEFFAQVAAHTALPIAIQNAPHYLGRGLSPDDILRLQDRCPGFSHIKSETAAVDLAALIARAPGLTVLNGRGGIEMTARPGSDCAEWPWRDRDDRLSGRRGRRICRRPRCAARCHALLAGVAGRRRGGRTSGLCRVPAGGDLCDAVAGSSDLLRQTDLWPARRDCNPRPRARFAAQRLRVGAGGGLGGNWPCRMTAEPQDRIRQVLTAFPLTDRI